VEREIHSSGTRRECGLEQVGAVGREQERDVGVLVDPVHLVQDVEQQGVRLGVPAVLRDEIHILQSLAKAETSSSISRG
jgi:hypothetical protein